MNKPVKVHMLPTEDKTHIAKIREDIVYWKNPDKYYKSRTLDGSHYRDATFQHLYFTSDEEIKIGDWALNGNQMIKISKNSKGLVSWRKIVATTDKSLKILNGKPYESQDLVKVIVKPTKSLSQIPQQFQENYVKASGKIDEVLLEYEWWDIKGKDTYKPKTDQNNSLIIRSVEPKLYTELQMKQAFIDGWVEYEDVQGVDFDKSLNNWIKENLK